MSEMSKKLNINSLNSPTEPFPGLSIDDLNKYLPAIQTVEDMSMIDKKIKEGMFLTKCIDGFKKLPDESIDLIIARPPEDNWETTLDPGQGNTLQDYYKWNQTWLEESIRVLKNTGAIYIFCPWQYSGMYHGLLSNFFNVQTRITWKNTNLPNGKNIWVNQVSDIWFATKTDEFLFNQHPVGFNTIPTEVSKNNESNLWIDATEKPNGFNSYPQKLYSRILNASSFNLNWVLDPFMGLGDVGVACKNEGRRFIGFETNKDYLLVTMKRIDNS